MAKKRTPRTKKLVLGCCFRQNHANMQR